MDGVKISPQKIIPNPKGNIMHALKAEDPEYVGFGEAYFSNINKNEIKGWKKHNIMTLNILVPVGEVEFVIFNGIEFFCIKLSTKNYNRLTIKPKLWVAFRGIDELNMLINLASHQHDQSESENLPLSDINYTW